MKTLKLLIKTSFFNKINDFMCDINVELSHVPPAHDLHHLATVIAEAMPFLHSITFSNASKI